jgi:hypothetical protein
MPYPDLEPSPTFWRCASCGNEALFRASGIGSIACGTCGKVSSEQQLLETHAQQGVVQPAQRPAANFVRRS